MRHGRGRSLRVRLGAGAAAAAACLLAAGVGAASATATLTATSPPTISEQTPLVDDTVAANPGSWTGNTGPITYSYQWYDCDSSTPPDCDAIPGATGATYTVQPTDGGDGGTLQVEVDAADGGGDSGTADSAPTSPVAARSGAPVDETDPVIGAPGAGGALTATAGTWSNNPTSYTYQWYACAPGEVGCIPIPGANQLSYTPNASTLGAVFAIAVYATNAAGDSVADYSAPSAEQTGSAPTITVTSPANGETYAEGAQAAVSFSCQTFDGSPAAVCIATDDLGDTLNPGGALNTSVPGQHVLTITAVDDYGSAATATVDYAVGGSGATGAAGSTGATGTGTAASLSLTRLRQSATRWRVAGSPPHARSAKAAPVGTSFSFTASAAARVTFTFSRLLAGRMEGSGCAAPTHANRHDRSCRRERTAGSLVRDARAGANRDGFDGRLAGSARLAPGRYAVVVTARPLGAAAGAAVRVGRLRFTIVR